MKLLAVLTLAVSLAAALDLEVRQGGGGGRRGREHKRTSRPKAFTGRVAEMRAPRRPANAPEAFKTDIGHPTRKRSKAALKKLPADLIDADAAAKRDEYMSSMRVAAMLKRQSTANDFYECQSSNPYPKDADCQVVIDQLFASNDQLVVAQNGCLTFSYQTCEGFFCALCSTLSTNSYFIGNQLSSAESLCVSQNQAGTIVGQDAPQWDAGFVYEGDSLPSYDVC